MSQRKLALAAGGALLLMAAVAMFSYGFVLGNSLVAGDAAATAKRIAASMILFRCGMAGFVVVLVCDVVVSWALYGFLRPVNKSLSLLAAWLRLAYAAVLGAALLNLVMVVLVLSGAGYLTVFAVDQVQAQVMLFLEAFALEWAAGLAVFGCHLLLLGWLVFKSGYIPRILGILLLIGAVGYLTTSFAHLLLPGYGQYKATLELVLSLPMAIGEMAFALWLLLRGGKAVS